MIYEALNWYLSPWRRIGRGPFNVALALAALPGIVLVVYGLTTSGAGFLAPLLQMFGAAGSLQEGVQGGLDPVALSEALNQMQGAGEGFQQWQQNEGVGSWADWVDPAMWLLMLPLMQMRLRDVGVKPRRIWWWTAALYAGMVMDMWIQLGLGNPFGGWRWLAYGVNMILLTWLVVAKSRPREQPEVTGEAPSAKVSLDDTDPLPPFRP